MVVILPIVIMKMYSTKALNLIYKGLEPLKGTEWYDTEITACIGKFAKPAIQVQVGFKHEKGGQQVCFHTRLDKF